MCLDSTNTSIQKPLQSAAFRMARNYEGFWNYKTGNKMHNPFSNSKFLSFSKKKKHISTIQRIPTPKNLFRNSGTRADFRCCSSRNLFSSIAASFLQTRNYGCSYSSHCYLVAHHTSKKRKAKQNNMYIPGTQIFLICSLLLTVSKNTA